LLPGKLNVVGENHAESGPRRDLEKAFAKEMTGNANYWTEADFLDLHQKVGIRKMRGGQGQAKNPGADLMEYRAVHGVAMLIDGFDKLCDEASRVAGISDNSAKAAVTAFVTVNVKAFLNRRKRIVGTWEPTVSDSLDDAVQAVFDNVNAAVLAVYDKTYNVLNLYLDLVAHEAAVDMQLAFTQDLANERAAVDALLPPLLTAAGVPQTDNPVAVANDMRKQRSAYMGLATTVTDQVGVWKIGDLHIQDLMDGTVNIDMSRANFVTRDDFNQAYEAWKLQKEHQLLLRKVQQRKLQQQQVQQKLEQQQLRQQQLQQRKT
jgi:hypothetical protein